MNRKAFALALIGAAAPAVGCVEGGSDGSTVSEVSAVSASSIGEGGACVTTAPGRQGDLRGAYARVRFSKDSFGDHATVELYDSKTGLLVNQPADYLYRVVGSDRIELYYLDSGDRFTQYWIRISASGAELVDDAEQSAAPVPLRCALSAGAPGLSLPVAQRPAEAKAIGASFPLPPRGTMANCVSTRLVGGKVLQLHFERARLHDRHLTAYANIFDPTTHFVSQDLLAGAEARFVDGSSSFRLQGAPAPNADMITYGEIVAAGTGADRHLALESRSPALASLDDVPLACDFED